MRKKALAVAFISVFLFSAVAGTLFMDFASANFIPEQAPSGIRIKSDGTVEGTNMLNRVSNVYTFTGDIHNTIVVLCDDIVLDGAGYTLRGNGSSTGVFLQDRSNVTIKNINIRNFNYGVKSVRGDYSQTARISNSIFRNNITDNTIGVSLAFSIGHVVSENRIANNEYGASLYSSGNVFRNNRFDGNDCSIYDNSYGGANDIDTSNTVNGKPVYYWVDQHDRTVPSDAGFVVLKNCSGITVQNLNLTNNGQGVLLCYTTSTTIAGNVLTNNLDGVTLFYSSNNVISGNRITNNRGYGVYLFHSKNNIISKNEITANANDGVNFEGSVSSTVSENLITVNKANGIFFRSIQGSTVVGNNITMNAGSGIGFGYGPNGVITGNYISKNRIGIWISNAEANTITLNTITENAGWGIELEGAQKNNVIQRNNFINNAATHELQARVAEVWSYPALGINVPPDQPLNQTEMPKLVGGAANIWDDGKEGNYWSDYNTRYPNASMVGGTRVGDTPYFINENNIDYHPLMEPLTIAHINLPPLNLPSPSSSPLPSPSQEPAATQESQKIEPIPATWLTASVVAVAVVSVSLLVYFKKYRRQCDSNDLSGD